MAVLNFVFGGLNALGLIALFALIGAMNAQEQSEEMKKALEKIENPSFLYAVVILTCVGVGLMIASQVNRYLAGRVHPEVIVRTVLPIAVAASATLLVDAYTGFGGFAGILVPLFCFVACHGFVGPNTTALAMSPYRSAAGSASALMGTLQCVLGAASGSLVSALGNGTAVPFAAVIAGCGLAAFAARLTIPAAGTQSTA